VTDSMTTGFTGRSPGPVAVVWWGERSDADHMSAPDPEGRGAESAIRQALEMAGRTSQDIGHVNLHGTGTRKIDEMESRVINRLFGPELPVSSTKGMSGHALGAAGALEAAFCWLSLHPDHGDGRLPPHAWDGQADPSLAPVHLCGSGERLSERRPFVLSNGFAFGGNNAVLVFGPAEAVA
jgi:3-oxoacyl-[acyl-carrier-protein] synthase I